MLMTLAQNISLLVAVVVVNRYVIRRLAGKPTLVSIVNGLVFGAAAIIGMRTPFTFAPGIIYDGRTIILGASAMFGGPLAAGIGSSMALAYRILVVGGTGYLAGILSIITAVIVGLVFYGKRKRDPGSLGFERKTIVLAAYSIHICMLLSQFALPGGRWMEVLPIIVLPVLSFYPLGFYSICALFLDDEERQKALSALKESEERYRALFMNAHTVMFLVDPASGTIVDTNPAAEKFFGWKRDELIAKNVSELNTMSPAQIRAEMRKAESGTEKQFNFKHRLASGEVVDVEVFSGPLELGGKKLLFSIIHDITARRMAEREVQDLTRTLELRVKRRTRELESANRELEAFSYSVSHDLRAPLRAITGFADMLAEESGPQMTSTSRHYLERIRINAQRMAALIDDLMRLARIARQDIHPQDLDLSALAGSILAEYAAKDPERRVDLSVEPGMRVKMDPALAEVFLGNLLSNAWKFTSRVPDARIRFFRQHPEDEEVYVLEDNGAGFDMAFADKLFNPFQRLHSSDEFEGTGIGLSLARRIIERHGGRIWAESKPGSGSAFHFTLGAQAYGPG